MSFFDRRRNPEFAKDLEAKMRGSCLMPDDVLSASNRQKQTLVVKIDTKGEPRLYQYVKANIRGWDVLYKTGEAMVLFALVPDEKAAKTVSEKILRLVQKFQHDDYTEQSPQVTLGLQINAETREATFDTEEYIGVGELLERFKELRVAYPGIFKHVDIVKAKVRTNADYLSCSLRPEDIVVGRGAIIGDKKSYRLGARVLGDNFVVWPERPNETADYDAPNKTLNIKVDDVYSSIVKSDIDD